MLRVAATPCVPALCTAFGRSSGKLLGCVRFTSTSVLQTNTAAQEDKKGTGAVTFERAKLNSLLRSSWREPAQSALNQKSNDGSEFSSLYDDIKLATKPVSGPLDTQKITVTEEQALLLHRNPSFLRSLGVRHNVETTFAQPHVLEVTGEKASVKKATTDAKDFFSNIERVDFKVPESLSDKYNGFYLKLLPAYIDSISDQRSLCTVAKGRVSFYLPHSVAHSAANCAIFQRCLWELLGGTEWYTVFYNVNSITGYALCPSYAHNIDIASSDSLMHMITSPTLALLPGDLRIKRYTEEKASGELLVNEHTGNLKYTSFENEGVFVSPLEKHFDNVENLVKKHCANVSKEVDFAVRTTTGHCDIFVADDTARRALSEKETYKDSEACSLVYEHLLKTVFATRHHSAQVTSLKKIFDPEIQANANSPVYLEYYESLDTSSISDQGGITLVFEVICAPCSEAVCAKAEEGTVYAVLSKEDTSNSISVTVQGPRVLQKPARLTSVLAASAQSVCSEISIDYTRRINSNPFLKQGLTHACETLVKAMRVDHSMKNSIALPTSVVFLGRVFRFHAVSRCKFKDVHCDQNLQQPVVTVIGSGGSSDTGKINWNSSINAVRNRLCNVTTRYL